jgi:hypothetical protein
LLWLLLGLGLGLGLPWRALDPRLPSALGRLAGRLRQQPGGLLRRAPNGTERTDTLRRAVRRLWTGLP